MGSIIGIPTTRVSDLFVRQRLTSQVQRDQLELFQAQLQLSTGHRFQVPSEDADAASRVIALQRLLERKGQIKTNLHTGQTYLTATDTALSSVSGILTEVRAAALGVIGNTSSSQERDAAAQQVQRAIEQLLDAGNRNFRGRYLFAGSTTSVRPFESDGGNIVRYNGNESRLASYSDLNALFDTSFNGQEVFGAISESVQGNMDLDPVVTYQTRLADLRGGSGISGDSIAVVSDGNESIIDLSRAETLGDVAALIRANPPAGKQIDVEITHQGLVIDLVDDPTGTLAIREVGRGTAAQELGILTEAATVDPIVGDDLDPIVRTTTRIKDLLGTRAYARLQSDGADNDLIFEADEVGPAGNGIRIALVDDGSVLTAGTDETATYDSVTQTLTITVKTGYTAAVDVADAVNTAFDAGTVPLRAYIDPLDNERGGLSAVDVPPLGTFAGETDHGGGTPLDLDSGLQITNGGTNQTVRFTDAETVEDLVNTLNMADVGVLAEINAEGTGINIRTRLSGTDFMIGENGGTTAAQLGLRSFTAQTRLEDLNHGQGVGTEEGADFTITLSDPALPPIEIDVSGIETIGELLAEINSKDPANLRAQLASHGNGVELVDLSGGPDPMVLEPVGFSTAAYSLGLIPEGDASRSVAPGGGPLVMTGTDVNPLEAEGVFTALVRLKTALQSNDMAETERAMAMLDGQTTSLSFVRAELGSRLQTLDSIGHRLEAEDIDLQAALSEDFDADLAEVISNFTARQIAYEASLQSTAKIFGMTLLNYL